MSPAAGDEPPGGQADREMLVELLSLHAKAMLRMPWVQSLLMLGIALFIYPYVRWQLLLGWAVLSVGVEVLRARYAAHIRQRGDDMDPVRVHRQFVGLAALAGAAIAVGAVLFLPALPIWDQALFGAVMLAIPAAGVAVSQSSRYIVAAYAGTLLLPAAITWCLLYPDQAAGGAVLIGLMLAVLILVAADGEKLLFRSVAIRHDRDRLVRDLEQRNADVRVAMAQAEQSAQARARVLAAASHDLRQPLHALSVYSAVLGAKPAPELLEEVSQNIDQIVRSLGSLLNGLLDLSRLSAGYYVPERKSLALDALVASVCAEYQQAAAQRGLALTQELAPVRVLGDPVALGRIARNLIDNALKYTERGGVQVCTQLRAGWGAGVGADGRALGAPSEGAPLAVLCVADTGKGIPASEHSRIFEEFYQLDNAGRDRSKGVGLGLAIVQRLCELIGARISVESAVGEGTSFRVSLPALLEADAAPAPAPPPPAQESLRGKRVLVVDDEHDILHSMRTLLGVWGLQAATADRVHAAEEFFEQSGAPDLLIVDLRLGAEEHGARLADRLQQKYGAFAVLIMTGETSSEALRQANERSYTLLQKPIAPELLREAIVAAVSGSPMGRQSPEQRQALATLESGRPA